MLNKTQQMFLICPKNGLLVFQNMKSKTNKWLLLLSKTPVQQIELKIHLN